MALFYSWHIHGIWKSKDVGGRLKLIIWGGNTSHKAERGAIFYGGGGFSVCNTAVLKLYCKPYKEL